MESERGCALPGIPGSFPVWSLPAKGKDATLVSRQLVMKRGLVDFLVAGEDVGWGLVDGGGRRKFPTRSGAEVNWPRGKPCKPLLCSQEGLGEGKGKRFGIEPTARAVETHDEPSGRQRTQEPRTVHNNKLFTTKRTVRLEDGQTASRRTANEMSHEMMMTRKRSVYFKSDARNNIPEAAPGDKSYHCPSHSHAFHKDSAALLPKCGVEKTLPPMQACSARRAIPREDLQAVHDLPKVPKDGSNWDFLSK